MHIIPTSIYNNIVASKVHGVTVDASYYCSSNENNKKKNNNKNDTTFCEGLVYDPSLVNTHRSELPENLSSSHAVENKLK